MIRLKAVWLAVALLATVLVYLKGLSGEFIYDDISNFETLNSWVRGEADWQSVVLNHNAGPLGRPLSMLTFLGNAAFSGVDPYWFKLTNLVVHLLIGVVVFQVLRRLSGRDPLLCSASEAIALLITAIWLLHPMMVGTVLYAVQRMAMLSALFMLLAMLSYIIGRERIISGNQRHGLIWIFGGVPSFTFLGVMCKENALLAPMLCAVIEWVYFKPAPTFRRPPMVRLFLFVGFLLPVVAGLLLFALRPEFFLQGYDNRPFTAYERLLTQGRVLFDYVGNLLIPIGPSMSLFRDDYPLSKGPLMPWTTSLALCGWILAVATAYRLCKTIPAYSAGIGIFLVGHIMESSIFPLLLYFEHRNYLPSLGIFLAAAGLIAYAFERIRPRLVHPKVVAVTAPVALILVLAGSAFARVMIWSDNELLLTESLKRYPDSRTARLALAELEMNRTPPRLETAQAQYRHLLSLERPSTRLIGAAGILASSCHAETNTEPEVSQLFMSLQPESIEADLLSALTSLTEITLRMNCHQPGPVALASRLEQVAESSPLPDEHKTIWQLRFRASQLFEYANMFDKAEELSRRAWHETPDQLPVGVLLLRLSLLRGNQKSAEELLSSIERLLSKDDKIGQQIIQSYRDQMGRSDSTSD